SSLEHPWLKTIGPLGICHELGQACVCVLVAQPTQSIDEADSLERDFLATRCLQHDQANQIVSDGEHVHLLEHSGDALAVQDFQTHRRLEVTEVDFNLPSTQVQFGERRGRVGDRIQECCHQ